MELEERKLIEEDDFEIEFTSDSFLVLETPNYKIYHPTDEDEVEQAESIFSSENEKDDWDYYDGEDLFYFIHKTGLLPDYEILENIKMCFNTNASDELNLTSILSSKMKYEIKSYKDEVYHTTHINNWKEFLDNNEEIKEALIKILKLDEQHTEYTPSREMVGLLSGLDLDTTILKAVIEEDWDAYFDETFTWEFGNNFDYRYIYLNTLNGDVISKLNSLGIDTTSGGGFKRSIERLKEIDSTMYDDLTSAFINATEMGYIQGTWDNIYNTINNYLNDTLNIKGCAFVKESEEHTGYTLLFTPTNLSKDNFILYLEEIDQMSFTNKLIDKNELPFVRDWEYFNDDSFNDTLLDRLTDMDINLNTVRQLKMEVAPENEDNMTLED